MTLSFHDRGCAVCVQFLDEPTSGLDAQSAAAVMDATRNVAENNRTVMVTIHQPSIEIFVRLPRPCRPPLASVHAPPNSVPRGMHVPVYECCSFLVPWRSVSSCNRHSLPRTRCVPVLGTILNCCISSYANHPQKLCIVL